MDPQLYRTCLSVGTQATAEMAFRAFLNFYWVVFIPATQNSIYLMKNLMLGIQDMWEFINFYGVNTGFTIQALTFKMHVFAVFNSVPHLLMVMTEDLKKHFEGYSFDIKRSILICLQIDCKCTQEQCTSVWGWFLWLNECFVVNNLLNCFNLSMFAYILKIFYNFL